MSGTPCFFEGLFDSHNIFSQEEEAGRKVLVGSFDVSHGSRGGDSDECGIL
jgi:hypothetical protein